jgi:hypothetical protein
MTSRLLIFSLLILSAFFLAACGGGGAGNEDARLVEQYGLSLDIVEAGSADYALAVQEAETVLVDVRVENAVDMTRSYVELNYDSELITPLRVMDGGFLGADTLFLQVTDRPHRVPVVVARTGRSPEGVSGRGVIARVEFARGAFTGRETASVPGQAKFTGFDVDQELNEITAHWTDDNSGDTNKDRHLNGLDVFPIATAFNSSFGDPEYQTCIDANGDNSINGLDIFPLAAKFDMRFDAYNVYWDFTPEMEGAIGDPENPSPIQVDYMDSCAGIYQYTIGPLPEDNEFYIGVTTLDNGDEGEFSVSEPQVLGTPNYYKPAANFWAENYGDYIFLDWDKPQTSKRVMGYHVFRKPETSGSYEDVSGKIAGTMFEDYSIGDLDTGNYLYHVVVEYSTQNSDPTPDATVFWERTNLPPWINEVTTSNFTVDNDGHSDATLHVDGDDGEGGNDITWTWEILDGSGSFPGGNVGETVVFESSEPGSSEKILIQVTGDDGTVPCSETIRLVYTTLPRLEIGLEGPANGYYVNLDMEYLASGDPCQLSDFFDQKKVLLLDFWAYW